MDKKILLMIRARGQKKALFANDGGYRPFGELTFLCDKTKNSGKMYDLDHEANIFLNDSAVKK